jgi:archaeal flagellar protein FlaJ
MKERIPFIYFPERIAVRMSKKLQNITAPVKRLLPRLEHDLKSLDNDMDSDTFIVLVLFNSLLWLFFTSTILFLVINLTNSRTIFESVYFSLGLGVFVFAMMFIVTIRYPIIKSGKKVEDIDRNLVFALKDLLLQVSAGMSLYDAIVSVSNSNFGEVSKEFGFAAKQIQSGMPMDKALEGMALRSNSDYLKRTVWQLVNVLRSGSNFKAALHVIIQDLLTAHKEKIKQYGQELNMWSLMFMMFAVAIPTIGSTVMLIMTSFSGAGISRSTFIVFVLMCLAVQYIIIGLIQSRRPQINM